MRKLVSLLIPFYLLVTLTAVLAGCSTNTSRIRAVSQSVGTNIFSVVSGAEEIPKGYADLEIKASIKTRTSNYFPFESKDSVRGKPGYPFLVNVDGQIVTWKVDGQAETAPRYLGGGARNPEGGIGVRYVLDKRIRLTPGAHRIFLALPGEDYYRETDVDLKDGRLYILLFDPVYEWRSFTKSRHFLAGIEGFHTTIVGVGSVPGQ